MNMQQNESTSTMSWVNHMSDVGNMGPPPRRILAPPLSIPQILAWADAHHREPGVGRRSHPAGSRKPPMKTGMRFPRRSTSASEVCPAAARLPSSSAGCEELAIRAIFRG